MIDFEHATFKEAALEYAKHDIAVFPLQYRGKLPRISAKDGGRGVLDATTDPAQIEEWWTKYPNANIGIATGQPNGIVVIDVDRDEHKNGPGQFALWEEVNDSFGDSWRVTTGRGGYHLYIKTNLDLHNVQNDQPSMLSDIDIRGYHGYVVAPPSVHANGEVYMFDAEHAPGECQLAHNDELLQKLYNDLTPSKQSVQQTQNAQTVQPAHGTPGAQNMLNIPVGSRNGTITSLLGKLQHAGFPDDLIKQWAHDINGYCEEPLSDHEVDTIANSVTSYEKGTIRTVKSPAGPRFKSYDVADYITGEQLTTDIDYFKKYSGRKTGFYNIDQYLTLYPGLAAIGGAASLGKSTFCVNMADNLVEQGETVLYFSLEQEPVELVTKSLARRLNEKTIGMQINTRLTNTKIKNGESDDSLDQVKREYAADVAGKFFIVRGDFTTTAADIRDYIEQFIRDSGIRPIVFVDYLQLISPPEGFKGDQRAATDLAIKTFKIMQTVNELLVVMVSNFNRSGYDSPVTYSDFKETGMIEYTCDYIWGLQLEILSHHDFYYRPGSGNRERMTTPQERDEMIDKAVAGYPKVIQFVSLKNRNGKQRFKCNFFYYMQYDCFISDLVNTDELFD